MASGARLVSRAAGFDGERSMATKTNMIIGAATLAALAAPAIAQYYPPPQNPRGGILGAIIDSYRYGQYPHGNYGYQNSRDRRAVDQCARSVEARLRGNYGYGNWGYGDQRYNRYRNFGRVEGITRVERRNNGVKVWGVASSGWGGYDGYVGQGPQSRGGYESNGYESNGYSSYGYHAGADLKWDCRVDYRGLVRDIDIRRRTANWRGY